jgi:hypothetical protein
VSFTSMTVHMETVYAADKNVTCRRFLASPRRCMDSSDASNVSTYGLNEATTYFLWLGEESAGISESSADRCNHNTEYPDSPDISLNDVSFTSMTVHMETVYADKRMLQVSTFPGTRMTVPWIVRMLSTCTSRVGRSYNIYFFWLDKDRRNQRKLGGHQCNHVQNIPDSPDISLNVSFTSMTVHGNSLRRRQECYGV